MHGDVWIAWLDGWMPDDMGLDQTELVIGLVAAVGTDIETVSDLLASELGDYDYTSETLRLSDYLADLEGVEDFRKLPFDERLWEGMTAGDGLRREWSRGDALALWAISDIVATRDAQSKGDIDDGSKQYPAELHRHAYILRSLKTQDEVETLRAVYGSRFVLFAAYTPDDERESHLAEAIERSRKTKNKKKWRYQPKELIERDYEEEIVGGQQVSRTFHRADFFVRAADGKVARDDITRSLAILFGDPFRTPTRDEFGQFQAAGAALRSAEYGRQVGAAIANSDGSVIALGTNEVPKFGGGSHWEEDGQGNREFEVNAQEANKQHQEVMAQKLARVVLKDQEDDQSEADVEALATDLLNGGLRDITEFGRAVHAEMDALLDAARRGVSVRECTLYTTTFPCHNCARHIIAAGIRRVVFIEPYPKSKAELLHEDSIAIAQSEAGDHVDFQPFVGVSPRRYLKLFDAEARKTQGHLARADAVGKRSDFKLEKKKAHPVIDELEPEELRPALPAYRRKELTALRHFDRLCDENESRKAADKLNEKGKKNG